MQVTWETVDKWREARGMKRSELARRAGIPERTIYAGLRRRASLQAATTAVMRTVFPEEFEEADA